MLVNMIEMLRDARQKSCAVGAFNAPMLETVRAVVAAAEESGYPVILQHAEVHENIIPMEEIAPIMLDYARRASVPVAVHFDHGSSFESCLKAMKQGFTSVMYDASAKSFMENSQETAEIVKIAHALGVSVEAELGHVFTSAVGGGEGRGAVGADDYDSLDDCYTNADEARRFVELTGVDCLAICFGTTHGVYLAEPKLNLERISEIKRKIDIPFVMHGGSGVSAADYRAAIKNGITKINYYTYMAMAGGSAVGGHVRGKAADDKLFFHDMSLLATRAMKENAAQAMKVFAMKD